LTIESKRFQDNNQCIWGIWLMIVINVFGIQLGIYSDKLHKDFIKSDNQYIVVIEQRSCQAARPLVSFYRCLALHEDISINYV
jgi:hypothetical protein